MNEIERILQDLEHSLDVLEAALVNREPLVAEVQPFTTPAPSARLTAERRDRAEALQRRLLAAQELVAGELERTRQQLALTEQGEQPPRFLDTTF